MTREITHMRAFTAALDSMDKPQFSVGIIKPTPTLVDQFSTLPLGKVSTEKGISSPRGIIPTG